MSRSKITRASPAPRRGKNQPRIPNEFWEKHLWTACQLYARVTVDEVVEIAQKEWGSSANRRQFTHRFNSIKVYKNHGTKGSKRSTDQQLCPADFHLAISDYPEAFNIYFKQLGKCTLPKHFLGLLINCARSCDLEPDAHKLQELIAKYIMDSGPNPDEETSRFISALHLLDGYIDKKMGRSSQIFAEKMDRGLRGLLDDQGCLRLPETLSAVVEVPVLILLSLGVGIHEDRAEAGTLDMDLESVDYFSGDRGTFGHEWEDYGEDGSAMFTAFAATRTVFDKGKIHQMLAGKLNRAQELACEDAIVKCVDWAIKKLSEAPSEMIPEHLNLLYESLAAAQDGKDSTSKTWTCFIYLYCFLYMRYYEEFSGKPCDWSNHAFKYCGISTPVLIHILGSLVMQAPDNAPAHDQGLESAFGSRESLFTFLCDRAKAFRQEERPFLHFLDEYQYLITHIYTPQERDYMQCVFKHTRSFGRSLGLTVAGMEVSDPDIELEE